jgi:hypothetical protein
MTNATANAGLPDVIEEGEEGTTGDHDQLPPPPRDTNGVVKEKLVNVADLEYMKDGGGSAPAPAVANGGPKLTRHVMNEHDRRSSSPRPRSSSGGRDERVAQSYPYLASDNKITEMGNGRSGGGGGAGGGVSSVAASAGSSSPYNTGTPGGDGDARGLGLASGGTLDTPVMTGQGGAAAAAAAAAAGIGAGVVGVRASGAGHDHAFPFPSCECDGAAIG